MMTRIRGGWALAKQSLRVLRSDAGLTRFPLLGGLAALAILASAVVLALVLDGAVDDATVPIVVLAVLGVYLAIFAGYYFSVGLVFAADEILHGREATLGDGLRVSGERAGAIAGWALLSTTVGVIFAAIEQIDVVGPIVSRLLDAAWSLITFLALPVIAIEGTGPIETTRRSAGIFRQKWAGQVTGNIAIGGIVLVAGVLPSLAIGIGGYMLWNSSDGGAGSAVGLSLVGIGALLLLASFLAHRTLSGIFSVALYRYATGGEALGGFTSEQLESAVSERAS